MKIDKSLQEWLDAYKLEQAERIVRESGFEVGRKKRRESDIDLSPHGSDGIRKRPIRYD